MYKLNPFTLIFVSVAMLVSSQTVLAADFKDSTIYHIEFPSWFIDSPFLELNEDLANAHKNGKQGLMVLYTTEGCSYCHVFIKKHLSDPEIVSQIQKHFDSVGLEIFDDAGLVDTHGNQMSIKAFAKQEGVMFSPTILFYGENGKRLLRITGYQSPERFKTSLNYVTGKHYLNQTFAEYVQKIEKPQKKTQTVTSLKKDPLFGNPPHLLQRNVFPASQPLLVIFEENDCSECENFHNVVLGNTQVRTSLEHFEVVRLNARDNKSYLITPDGERITPAAWYRRAEYSRVPALAFFNEQGQMVLDTDTLVQDQRMMNSINYVLERANLKGWSYQRFARTKAIERNAKKKLVTVNEN